MYNYHSRDSQQTSNSAYKQGTPTITGRLSTVSRNQQSRPEEAYSNYQEKMKALGRVRYINQLAQL